MYRLIFFLRKIPQTGDKAPTLHSHSFLPHSIPQPPAWAAGKSILTRDAPMSSLKGKAPLGFFSSNHNTKKVRLGRKIRVGKKKKKKAPLHRPPWSIFSSNFQSLQDSSWHPIHHHLQVHQSSPHNQPVTGISYRGKKWREMERVGGCARKSLPGHYISRDVYERKSFPNTFTSGSVPTFFTLPTGAQSPAPLWILKGLV